MSRINPLHSDDLPKEQMTAMRNAEALLGFVSNDALIIARNPALADALGNLVAAVYAPGLVDPGLKRLIGLMTSSAAGCQYCMGHTAFTSQRHGVEEQKLAAVWEFERSDLFTDAERAALRIALLAGQTPNGVTDGTWAELAAHYDEDAQLEIVAVIAMFGFLNRLNSTLVTDLESLPGEALRNARRSLVEMSQMGNREKLRQIMPAMLAHEGTWEGTYRFVDAHGNVIDQYRSRIVCEFPDDGPWVYVQKNHYAWEDGRVFETEFGGELRGDRIFWDTDRFSGYGWVTHGDIVMLTLDRKDNPGESFSEMIQIGADGVHRTRTWQWFRDGRPFQRTLCDERRVT